MLKTENWNGPPRSGRGDARAAAPASGRVVQPRNRQRGQVVAELAFQIPLMLVILFGCVQLARVFYVYHTLHKALRGGAGLLARSTNVDYCDPSDLALADARNFMVYGNTQGLGTPVVDGLTPELIQVLPERGVVDTTTLELCPCSDDTSTCSLASGGRAPDYVVVNLGTGYPLAMPFPYVTLGTINLRVSVRMPLTGS